MGSDENKGRTHIFTYTTDLDDVGRTPSSLSVVLVTLRLGLGLGDPVVKLLQVEV